MQNMAIELDYKITCSFKMWSLKSRRLFLLASVTIPDLTYSILKLSGDDSLYLPVWHRFSYSTRA